MMKMDGRDSAECQNWEKNDIMVILENCLNDDNVKNEQCHLFKGAVAGAETGSSSLGFF